MWSPKTFAVCRVFVKAQETMHNSEKTALFEKWADQQCADPPSKTSVFSLFGSDFCAFTKIR